MSDPNDNPSTNANHALTHEDQDRLRILLGQDPFAAQPGIEPEKDVPATGRMNSQLLLKETPLKSARILLEATEFTPGILDIGDGLAIVFKARSFNDPLDSDRAQRASRNTAQLIREILMLGARPKCLITTMCLGTIANDSPAAPPGTDPQSQLTNSPGSYSSLVTALAQVGGCFGIPTALGQVSLDERYALHPRVNAFCLGLLSHGQIPCRLAPEADATRFLATAPAARNLAGNNTKQEEPEPGDSYQGNDKKTFQLETLADTSDPNEALRSLLSWPPIACKNRGCPQTEESQSDVKLSPGSDAFVLLLKGDNFERILALAVAGNAAHVDLDAHEGGKLAVVEAARYLSCSGGLPIGATISMPFGNSNPPEYNSRALEAAKGIGEACRILNIPYTGGADHIGSVGPDDKNELDLAVAVIGTVPRAELITSQWFKDEGDAIFLLGDAQDPNDLLQGLGGSAYLQLLHRLKIGLPPRCNLEREHELQLALRALIHSGELKSAHACAAGGLAVALAESCISCPTRTDAPRLLGARIDLTQFLVIAQEDLAEKTESLRSSHPKIRLDAVLFGETQSRVIVSTHPLNACKVLARARLLGVPACQLGSAGGDSLTIKTATAEIVWPVAELYAQAMNHGGTETRRCKETAG